MEGVREYLLSVTAGAMLCGFLSSLFGKKGSMGALIRLIGALLLCFLVISPISRIDLSDFTGLSQNIISDGNQAAQEGQAQYRETLRQIITNEARAYIMEKARSYGAEIQVDITLSEDDPPVPEGCVISGEISPFVKQQLEKLLATELMIPEENHLWIP